MEQLETRSFLRSADILRRTLMVLLVALGVTAAGLLVWLTLDTEGLAAWLVQGAGHGETTLTGGQTTALAAILFSQIALWAAVLWEGRRMFTALLLTDAAAASVAARRAAALLWLMLVWGLLMGSLASVIATWHFPPGSRTLSMSIGTAEVSTLLAALLASFTSHAFSLGAALWQDHREVI